MATGEMIYAPTVSAFVTTRAGRRRRASYQAALSITEDFGTAIGPSAASPSPPSPAPRLSGPPAPSCPSSTAREPAPPRSRRLLSHLGSLKPHRPRADREDRRQAGALVRPDRSRNVTSRRHGTGVRQARRYCVPRERKPVDRRSAQGYLL
jgi:hypothetical protein